MLCFQGYGKAQNLHQPLQAYNTYGKLERPFYQIGGYY
jgi:hypothetical protein